MKSFFDKLNLRPHERRLVIISGMVVFLLLNWWFVWPYFGDWGKVQADLFKNRNTLARYQTEIGRRGQYERRVRELETTGSEMLTNENQFQSVITMQAAASGVGIPSITPIRGAVTSTRTNQFFQEGAFSVQFSSDGTNIVEFLVAMAAQNAMIRVRDMSVRPDQNQTRLAGNIIFVGNYQRAPTNAPAAGRTTAAATTATTAAAAKNTPKQNPKRSPEPAGKTPPAPGSNPKTAPRSARKNT
jgi:type II secretory pathway component PulM